jgi:hypothetical protein
MAADAFFFLYFAKNTDFHIIVLFTDPKGW